MAELTFKSAGVSTREIDLSGPTAVRPQGVPAGVIGTAQKGPAFVPITVATFADFVADFGGTDGKKFGPLAMNEWMRNARAGTYVRVLGVGDAKKRSDKGRVKNAGFVVGAQLPQKTSDYDGGRLGENAYAFDNGVDDQLHGRTFFLGALMRETYEASGESSASARLTFDRTAFVVSDFSDSPGEGIRFLAGDGSSHYIWFHEGNADRKSAGSTTTDLASYEDSNNTLFAVGARGSALLTIVGATADLDNQFIELTDASGNKFQAKFVDGGVTAGMADASTPGVINCAGAAADIAAELVTALGGSAHVEISTVDNGDGSVQLTLDSFGNSTDEPDGGAVISGNVTVVAPDGSTDIAGGMAYESNAALVDGLVSALTRSGVAADLSFSASGADLVITQKTAGQGGNDVADADAGSATITCDWAIDEAVIAVNPVSTEAESLIIQDQAGTTHEITISVGRTTTISADVGVASEIGTSASVAAEDVVTISNPAGEFHDGDTVTVIALDANGDVDMTGTIAFTTDVANPGTFTVADVGADGASVSVRLDDPDGTGFPHGGDATLNGLPATQLRLAIAQLGFALTLVNDATTVTVTQDNAAEAAVSPRVTLTPGNVEINGTDDGSVSVTEDGHTQITSEEVAAKIAEALELLAVDTTVDGTNIEVRQQLAGDTTIENANSTSFIVVTEDVDLDAEAKAGVDGLEPDGGGSLPTGFTLADFTGGETGVEKANHSHWEDAGIDTRSAAQPIIRAVIMTPAGVHASLRSLLTDRIDAAAGSGVAATASPTGVDKSGGSQLGLVQTSSSQQRFTILLNGHTDSDAHPSELRCSFDPQAPDYFMNVLNSDAACLEKAGHCVYAHYDVYSSYAGISTEGRDAGTIAAGDTAAGVAAGEVTAAFLVHGQNDPGAAETAGVPDADSDGAGVTNSTLLPNYEDFQDRFATAKSPWVISQIYGAKPKNLFKIHALDDGIAGSGKFKITISNIMKGAGDTHGKFDLFVRDITDDDIDPRVYEKFIGVDLNPNSDRYIARVVGDQYMYYDFDKRPGSQKLVVEGIHPQRSKYIRVEMAPEVSAGATPSSALPLGYRGYSHLVTSLNNDDDGVHYLQSGLTNLNSLTATPAAGEGTFINDAIEPPVPVRTSISQGSGNKKRPNASLCWGTMFQVADNLDEANSSVKFNPTILSHCKYFPTFRADSQPKVAAGNNAGVKPPVDNAGNVVGAELDSDKFNNNMFTLERIQVITKRPRTTQTANPQVKGEIDHKQWAAAEYRRNGLMNGSIQTLEGVTIEDDPANDKPGTRFLDPKVDLASSTTRRYMKFSFFLQGGFDGTNIFDSQKAQLTNRAAVWEMDDAAQGGVTGSTVASFRKAIDVMAEKADVDIKLLAVPGMRDESITDYAIDAVEDRFDAMYIMDIEEKSVAGNLMVDYSSQKPSVNLTVEELRGRNLDSSFAAAYFPDVVITDPALGTNVQCPPSVAVLGAFSLNDSVAHPWFAPAGFSRGALTSVVETQVKLSRANLDALYESDINPLAAFPHTPGVVVWGQKTLQQAQSALDRVNVRRLLIEIRREVRRVGNNLLFEPNREETLGRFSAAVNPILQRIQQQQGLDKFKVVIDTTTTTQADIENNTVRGKIFLQPTRTVEFISLDFVVTNAGMEV